MFKVLLNFLLVSFTWISAQEMDVTILPSEVTSLPFEKKPHDVFQADSNKSILLISSDRNQLETIATHPVKGITPTLTLTPAPVPTPVPIARVNPHLGIIPLDSSSLAVQEKRMKNTLETQEYITYTVMNALMGLNLGYRGDLSFHSSHLTFHTYVGLFCYESEVVLKEGNFQDWTHYLGGGDRVIFAITIWLSEGA